MSGAIDQKHIELREPLTVLAILCTGIWALLRRFEAPGWVWLAVVVWIMLCLVAIFAQSTPGSRSYIAGTLRKNNFTQIYRFLAKPVLGWFWENLCEKVNDGESRLTTFKATLTRKLYNSAMLLAVAYPILLLTSWWIITGEDGKIGNAVILPAAPFWPNRAQVLALIVMAAILSRTLNCTGATYKNSNQINSKWKKFIGVSTVILYASGYTSPIVFAVIFAVVLAFLFGVLGGILRNMGRVAVGVSCALGCILAVLVSIDGRLTYTFQGVVAALLAYAGTAVVLSAAVYLRRKNFQAVPSLLLTAIVPALWISFLLFFPWSNVPEIGRGIFLCLGVLPLINALFDVLSYSITLTLMRLGITSKQPLLYGVLDLCVALALFIGLGATLTVVIATMNRIAGVQISDLGALFGVIHVEPRAHWWLYAMMFSTVIPTALHASLSLLGAQAFVFRFMRRPVAGLLRDASSTAWKAAVAPLAVGTLWIIPFVVLGMFGWLFWRTGGHTIEWLGSQYFTALRNLAVWIGAF